jgi:hypothetical protein
MKDSGMSDKKPTIKDVGKGLGRSVAMDGALLKTPPKPAVNRTVAGGITTKINQPSKRK